MICEICKENVARVHLSEVSNSNIKMEAHLCEECAKTKGVWFKPQSSLAEVITSLVESQKGKIGQELADLTCPNCGISYPEFRAKLRLGCAKDYEFFRKGLEPLLEKIHGNIHHVGKVPPGYAAQAPPLAEASSSAKASEDRSAGPPTLSQGGGTGKPAEKPPAKAKEPKHRTTDAEIAELEKQLLELVRGEQFEKAAELRDKLKTLKEQSIGSSQDKRDKQE